VIRRLAVINFRTYQIFLQGLALTCDRSVDSKTKKSDQPIGIDEGRAPQDEIELGANLLLRAG
jgi:hypothetical protein